METDETAVSHWEEIVLKEPTFMIAVLIYHSGLRQNGIRETQIVSVLRVLGRRIALELYIWLLG